MWSFDCDSASNWAHNLLKINDNSFYLCLSTKTLTAFYTEQVKLFTSSIITLHIQATSMEVNLASWGFATL